MSVFLLLVLLSSILYKNIFIFSNLIGKLFFDNNKRVILHTIFSFYYIRILSNVLPELERIQAGDYKRTLMRPT